MLKAMFNIETLPFMINLFALLCLEKRGVAIYALTNVNSIGRHV